MMAYPSLLVTKKLTGLIDAIKCRRSMDHIKDVYDDSTIYLS